jgi:hypothetical protein
MLDVSNRRLDDPMRMFLVALTWALAAAAQPAAAVGEPIDLDQPGVLASLASRDPGHHRRITELVRVAEHADCESGELKRIQAVLVVADLQCSRYVMTSDPPKQRLAFTLDRARYVKVVTLRNVGARLMPAR